MDRKVNSLGLTIIELMVVLSIISILFSIGIPAYTKWKSKYDVEYDIKELFSLINNARIMSFTKKRTCGVYFGTSAFSVAQLRCDTDDDGDITDSGSEILSTYSPNKNFIASASYVRFTDGIAINLINIRPQTTTIDTGENCISISVVRTRIGRWDGSSCE